MKNMKVKWMTTKLPLNYAEMKLQFGARPKSWKSCDCESCKRWREWDETNGESVTVSFTDVEMVAWQLVEERLYQTGVGLPIGEPPKGISPAVKDAWEHLRDGWGWTGGKSAVASKSKAIEDAAKKTGAKVVKLKAAKSKPSDYTGFPQLNKPN